MRQHRPAGHSFLRQLGEAMEFHLLQPRPRLEEWSQSRTWQLHQALRQTSPWVQGSGHRRRRPFRWRLRDRRPFLQRLLLAPPIRLHRKLLRQCRRPGLGVTTLHPDSSPFEE
jgi:hypothetical protein